MSFGSGGWGDELAAGALLTIELALATLPFGLILGFLVALLKRTEPHWSARLADIYTTIFRGLPELLTIFIVYYGGQQLLQSIVKLFGDAPVEVNGFVAGMLALGLVFSAFASEVFTGAFRGIGQGQYEAARALGLKRWPVLRLVVLPQLIRLALPGLANLWLNLLKDTALVSVIALPDLLRETNIAVGATKQPFLFYLIACLIYLTMAIVSSFAIGGIERWTDRGMGAAR